jgi:hypothetical protein
MVTIALLLPLNTNKSTDRSSNEQATTKGINQAGFWFFFFGPNGLDAIFFFFVFWGAATVCFVGLLVCGVFDTDVAFAVDSTGATTLD